MRIDLTRSGGFAGITARASLDSAELGPGDAAMIEQAIKGTDRPRPEGQDAVPASAVDRYQYDLTVTTGDGSRQLSAGEQELAPELRHLLDELLRRQH